MRKIITFEGMELHITQKNIRSMTIQIPPGAQHILISLPEFIPEGKWRDVIASQIDLIQQHFACNRTLEPAIGTVPKEKFKTKQYWLGEPYQIQIVYQDGPYKVTPKEGNIIQFSLPPHASQEAIFFMWDGFCEDTVRNIVEEKLPKWQKKLGIQVNTIEYKVMRRQWSGCTPRTKRISINTQLATKHPGCIEYILVYALSSLLECSSRNNAYIVMDNYFPEWRKWSELLDHSQ